MFTSINRFTASLAGTLFNSLEGLHCSTRPVSASSADVLQTPEEKNTAKGPAYGISAGIFSGQSNLFHLKVASTGEPEGQGSQEKDKATPHSATKQKAGPKTEKDLNQEEKQELIELQQRDKEVRAHEQAHITAGGPYVQGGASYTYQKGPDDKQYAIGGSVNIDTGAIPGNPKATLEKARTIRKAALAPASPSAQDQKIASQASVLEIQAQQELREKNEEEEKTTDSSESNQQRTSFAMKAYQTPPTAKEVGSFLSTVG